MVLLCVVFSCELVSLLIASPFTYPANSPGKFIDAGIPFLSLLWKYGALLLKFGGILS
jgi:hypothetical protein